MLPLGAVRVKDKALWAVQWSGWTHEHYSVLDVKDDDLIARVTAGGGGDCPTALTRATTSRSVRFTT